MKQIAELKGERRWVLWHLVKETDSKGNVKWKKVPDQITERGERYKGASSTDPNTWVTFAEVQAAFERTGDRFGGVGIMFNGDGLVGIDIDGEHDNTKDVRNPKENEVREIIGDTYTEISPSGNGLHLLMWADMDVLPCKVYESITHKGEFYTSWDKDQYKSKIDWTEDGVKYGLECYCGGRFFTFTGNVLDGLDTIENRTNCVEKFLNRYMQKSPTSATSKPGKGTRASKSTPTVYNSGCAQGDIAELQAASDALMSAHSGGKVVDASDRVMAILCGETLPEDEWKLDKYIERRLHKAMNDAIDSEKFSTIYNTGNWEKYGYPSQNEADMYLIGRLVFWLGKSPDLVDRAFRKSALYRDKWEREDYRTGTIARAIENAGDNIYHGKDDIPTKYKPENYSDRGNAKLFVSLVKDVLRYCPALGWLKWDGHLWRVGKEYPGRLAQQFADRMLDEAKQYYIETQTFDEDNIPVIDKDAKDYLAHARNMQKAVYIKRMIELSQDWLTIQPEELDADPFTLCTPGGVVDLHTGKIRKAVPGDYCTKVTAAAPGDQGAEMWNDFLKLVTCGDAEVEGYLRRVCGMAAIGKVFDEKLIVAFNKNGHNGKSTMFNSVQRVLGTYGGSIDVNVLTTDRTNKGASLATLRGKRFIVCGELDPGKWLSTSMLKHLVSTDRIVGEHKFQDPLDFEPTHHVIMYTNPLPRVASRDGGTWRRLELVPFMATMPQGKADIKNYASLLSEKAAPAIMRWVISGAVEYIGNGYQLDPPETVLEATRQYKGIEDWCEHFIEQNFVKAHPDERLRQSQVYEIYKQWSADGGDNIVRSSRELAEELEAHGWQDVNYHNVKYWRGWDLNPDIYGTK